MVAATCPFSAISLFTGAGGLDLGFEAAGFATRVAVEMDADAVATIRRNRDWPLVPTERSLGRGFKRRIS